MLGGVEDVGWERKIRDQEDARWDMVDGERRREKVTGVAFLNCGSDDVYLGTKCK